MSKYKVLEEVEVLGTVRPVDSEIEVDAETAQPFVAGGKLELVVEGGETPAETTQEDATPAGVGGGEAPSTPTEGSQTSDPAPETPNEGAALQGEAPKEGEAGWVGGHSV